MSSNTQQESLRNTQAVKVNPVGDKHFYKQGGGSGLFPFLYQKHAHGGKLFYAFSPPPSSDFKNLFQKQKKKTKQSEWISQ